MVIVSTVSGTSLVFYNRDEIELLIKNLQMMVDSIPNTEKESAQVFTSSDSRIPIEEVKQLTHFIKGRFQHHDESL